MQSLNPKRCLGIAAAGAFVALTAVGLPARADELVQHLGPVGPHEPILTTFGNKRVIAFYEPDNGHCAVNAVVFDKTDADTGMTTAARVRVSLNPRQIVHIDSTDNKSINLQCSDRAEMLAPRSPAPTVSRAAPSTVVVPPSSVLSFMALMTVSRSGYWHKASVLLAELDVSS